jgi:peptidoglycan/LPS O-acetylase OafA/YrhL
MISIERVNSGEEVENANRRLFQLGYAPALDGLRGMSILAVIAFNSHLLWVQGGFVGVDIFFVLSGFLITSLLVQGYHRNSGIGLKNFYFRRALRLLPALVLLMLFCIAFALVFQPDDQAAVTLKGVVYTLFYVANWAQAQPNAAGIGPLSHAWSLSVEEQFYIIWPLLLLVLLKLKSKGLVLAILSSLISLSILTKIWFWYIKEPYLRVYFGSDTRAHELLIGCVAALLLSWGTIQRTNKLKWVFHVVSGISLAGILLSFFLVPYKPPFVYGGGFTIVCFGTAVLIVDLVLFPSLLSRCFEFRPLVWIGKISYGLYLWHFPIFGFARKFFEGRVSPVFIDLACLALTVLVAAASYYILERPFLRLRRRFITNYAATCLLTSMSRTAESM